MLPLRRLDDWPERLARLVEAEQGLASVWGKHDCATFFAAAIEAVTGIDPLAKFKPWSSEAGALRVLAASGFPSMQAFTRSLFLEIPLAKARRGDLVFPANPPRLAAPAVVVGTEAVSRDARGWVSVSVPLMTSAYRVG